MNVWSFRRFVILLLLLVTICIIDGATKKKNKQTTRNKYKRVFPTKGHRKPMKPRTPLQRRSVAVNKNLTKRDEQPIQDVHDIVRSSYDRLRHLHVLHVSESAVNLTVRTLERKPQDMRYTCGYRRITATPLGLYTKGSINRAVEIPFGDTYVVPEDVRGMIAICKNSLGDVLQVEPFTFVQAIKQPSNPQPQRHQRRPSVLMFGFNGMTSKQFRSALDAMPGLESSNQGWFEMQNYKRMGENSYINLMALISGYSPSAVHNLQSSSAMDAMPFIWQRYKANGYLTAYAEDLSLIRKFPFEFGSQPVDYYLRPFMRGIADSLHLRNRSTEYHGLDRRLYVDYVYDYCQQLLEHYLNPTQPLFGLFWTSNFVSSDQDKREPTLRDYIRRFEQMGLFRESIVIFFSDHVCHPMLFVWLPTWIRQQYPDMAMALAINTQRMTSPHDLYLTLQDIVNLGAKGPAQAPLQPEGCPACRTLFKEIPKNRTCHEAGRSENYCNCDASMELLPEETELLPLGWMLVNSLNEYRLSRPQLRSRCEAFSLQKVESIHQHWSALKSSTVQYRVRFTTQPKAARFLATVLYNHDTNKLVNVSVPSFGRLLQYVPLSQCVSDGNDKKFCVCKPTTKKKKNPRVVRRRKNTPQGKKPPQVAKLLDTLMQKMDKIEKSNALRRQEIRGEVQKLKKFIATSTTAAEWITYLEAITTPSPMFDGIETHVNVPFSLNF
ncbi:uncharacterized protein LOC111079841 [Drosophila obscura]|uniref:uncharacterized protein LOC111079841 n=1 Tax=Drosophila obscura TaxID=7282 RepID=UPI001BB2ADBC|nr:uncharacterized protein LOC111079841 [Drosophila obscura]